MIGVDKQRRDESGEARKYQKRGDKATAKRQHFPATLDRI
jgi:hypothetical protein